MQEFLEQIEIREAAGRDLAERLRSQIAELTAQLAAAEQALERLKITRETILDIAPDLPGGLAALPSPYRQIRALFENAADRLHPQGRLPCPGHRHRTPARRRRPRQTETPGQPRHPHRT
ncbi:hypothetical protein [Streptomyces sp. NPDC055099]